MSFVSYKYLRPLEYNIGRHSYEYEITDSDWSEVVVVKFRGAQSAEVRFGIAVINAYEKRNAPVAPNLALAFQYIAKRYGWTIEQVVNHNKKYKPKYSKYEQEVQKHLMLLLK